LTIGFSYEYMLKKKFQSKTLFKMFLPYNDFWMFLYIIYYNTIFFFKTKPWLDDDNDWLKYDSLSFLIVISRNPRGTYPNGWRCVCVVGVGLFAKGCHGRQTLYPRSEVAIVNYQPLGRDFCVLLLGVIGAPAPAAPPE